jgi:hypothetical protein
MQGPPPQASVRSARELLGVGADADAAQLASAYRRQARRLHPDISLEPDATEQFWALQAAYRLVLDAARHDAPPPVGPTAAAPTPTRTPTPTPKTTGHRDPMVVLGAPLGGGVPATTSRGGATWVSGWFVAGPVQVQPPRRTERGAAGTPPGRLPGDLPGDMPDDLR